MATQMKAVTTWRARARQPPALEYIQPGARLGRRRTSRMMNTMKRMG